MDITRRAFIQWAAAVAAVTSFIGFSRAASAQTSGSGLTVPGVGLLTPPEDGKGYVIPGGGVYLDTAAPAAGERRVLTMGP
jgi:hypothetical protein